MHWVRVGGGGDLSRYFMFAKTEHYFMHAKKNGALYHKITNWGKKKFLFLWGNFSDYQFLGLAILRVPKVPFLFLRRQKAIK